MPAPHRAGTPHASDIEVITAHHQLRAGFERSLHFRRQFENAENGSRTSWSLSIGPYPRRRSHKRGAGPRPGKQRPGSILYEFVPARARSASLGYSSIIVILKFDPSGTNGLYASSSSWIPSSSKISSTRRISGSGIASAIHFRISGSDAR